MARNSKPRKPSPRKAGWRDVSDEFWAKVQPLVPENPRSRKGGRPPAPHRTIFNGILYVLRTGCQWKMLPREYGSGSAAHAHFQKWTKAGIFSQLWKLCLLEYDDRKGIDWKWQSLDSVTVSAPVKGGIKQAKTRPIAVSSGPNGTDPETSAILAHLTSASAVVSILASLSKARFSSCLVLCLVPAEAINWRASVAFAF